MTIIYPFQVEFVNKELGYHVVDQEGTEFSFKDPSHDDGFTFFTKNKSLAEEVARQENL